MKTPFQSFLKEAIERKHPGVSVALAYSEPVALSFRERVFLTESNIEYQPTCEIKLYPKWAYSEPNLN